MNTLLNNINTKETREFGIDQLCKAIAQKDFCAIPAARMKEMLLREAPGGLDDLVQFGQSWNDLAIDNYMADGGRYRFRRHATLGALPSSRSFYVEPHQPHYQSLDYNSLNGGVARHYEPVKPEILKGDTMTAVMKLACGIFGSIMPYAQWHIEVHQFRIDVSRAKEGKPTPEGIHRDGVNFVLMMMVKRTNVVNGGTQIYDLDRRRLDSFTLTDLFDAAIVNDERVMHGVTPIVQLDTDREGYRDVLVVTFKKK